MSNTENVIVRSNVKLEENLKNELFLNLIKVHEARRIQALSLDRDEPRYATMQYEFMLGAAAVLDFLSGDTEDPQVWPSVVIGLIGARGPIVLNEKKGTTDWGPVRSGDIHLLVGYAATTIYKELAKGQGVQTGSDKDLETMQECLYEISNAHTIDPPDILSRILEILEGEKTDAEDCIIINEQEALHIQCAPYDAGGDKDDE